MIVLQYVVRIGFSILLNLFFFESLLEGKFNKPIRYLAWSIPYIAIGFVGQSLENLGIAAFTPLALTALFFLYTFVCYKDNKKYKSVLIAICYSIEILCDLITTSSLSIFFPEVNINYTFNDNTDIGDFTPWMMLVTIGFSFIFLVMFLAITIIKRIRLKETIRTRSLIFILFPFSQCLFLALFVRVWSYTYSVFSKTYVYIYICIAVALIADILCYKGLIQNSELSIVKMRNDHLEREREAQYKYYEKISEMQGEMMKYNHDFKNALQTAYALCESPDELSRKSGAEMLDTLKSRNEEIKAPFFCANPIVNTVLWDKSDEAKKLGIDLEVDASISDTGIDSVDLCCLIANALDNAIRGVEGSTEKRVDVKIKQEDKRIFMTVKNSARLPDFESGDRIPTTKVGKNHGYGTEIIKSIAERRNGDVLFSCKDNIFTCMATMAEE